MPTFPDNSTLHARTPADENALKDSQSQQVAEQISDSVQRADHRRRAIRRGDVNVDDDGTVTQKPHGNMDETMIATGKDHPEQGSYVPEHDHVDPDLESAEEKRK